MSTTKALSRYMHFLIALALLLIVCFSLPPAAQAQSANPASFADLRSCLQSGYAKLTRDLTISFTSSGTTIPGSALLDLNGHTINASSTWWSTYLFTVNGRLIITDSAGGGKIVLQGGNGICNVTAGGKLYLNSGTLTGNNVHTALVNSSGITQLQGTTLDGQNSVRGIKAAAGELTLRDGEIRYCTAHSGGAVETDAGCTLNVLGGTFHHNTAQMWGGAVNALGPVRFRGGIFRDNTGTHGGAVSVSNKALVEAGTFERNTAIEAGGAIWVRLGGVLSVRPVSGRTHAVKFLNNTGTTTGTYGYSGGAIGGEHNNDASQTSQIYVFDACITNNTAGNGGGGIAGCWSSGTAILEANACAIFSNTARGDNGILESWTRASASAQDIWSWTEASVSGIMLGGVKVRYTGSRNGSAFASNAGQTVTGSQLQLTTDLSSVSAANRKMMYNNAGALFEGNTAKYSGGAIASNGTIRLGGTPPNIFVPEPSRPDIIMSTAASSEQSSISSTAWQRKNTTLYDTVNFCNLTVGSAYTLRSYLRTSDGKDVLASPVTTQFTASAADMSMQIRIPCNTVPYAGRTLTVVQELYLNGALAASHTDLADPAQQITVTPVALATKASAESGSSVSTVPADTEADIYDTVEYTGLIPKVSYTLRTTLKDSQSGTLIPVSTGASTQFTPGSSDGSAQVHLTCNTAALMNRTLTVCQELYLDNVLIASHTDRADTSQQVSVVPPVIETTASASDEDTVKEVIAAPGTVIFDTVRFLNLRKGSGYRLVTSVADAQTGEGLSGVFPDTETVFTAESESPVLSTSISGNTSGLIGKTLVVLQKLYQGNVLLASHDDISDTAQQVAVSPPSVATSLKADGSSDPKSAWIAPNITLTDTVSYSALQTGREYTLRFALQDMDTGEMLLRETDSTPVRFTPSKPYGKIDVLMQCSTEERAGHTLVAYEYLYADNELVASHEDSDDPQQRVQVVLPELATSLSSDETETIKSVWVDPEVTLYDTVNYSMLAPGYEYTVRSALKDLETGEVLLKKDDSTPVTFTPDKPAGKLSVPIRCSTSSLAGHTLVAFEYLYAGDELLVSHELPDDKDQQIEVSSAPSISTAASSDPDGGSVTDWTDSATVYDTVWYQNCSPGSTYRLHTAIADVITQDIIEGTEKDTILVPDKNFGSLQVELSVNTLNYAGRTLVVLQTLYRGDEVIAQHTDYTNQKQQFRVTKPFLSTTAYASEDGFSKSLAVYPDTTIYDTVSWAGLKAGDTYVLTTTVADARTREPIATIPATVSTTFTAQNTKGITRVPIKISTCGLEDRTLVVLEELSRNGVTGAVHTNYADTAQQVRVVPVEIETDAAGDADTYFVSWHEQALLRDTVSLTNLVPGREYRLETMVADAQTHQEVLPEALITQIHPEDASLTLDVDITLSTLDLAGRTLVVLQKLWAGDDLIAAHNDYSDRRQQATVLTPALTTRASSSFDEANSQLPCDRNAALCDFVTYSNLMPNREYTLRTSLVSVTDGTRIVDEHESAFEPEEPDGTVVVHIQCDTTSFADHTLVVLQELLLDGRSVALHTDRNNRLQQVHVPVPYISTAASSEQNKLNKTVPWSEDAVIYDTVSYQNLSEHTRYTLKTSVADADTHVEIPLETAETSFMTDGADGSVTVAIPCSTISLAERTLVVLQELWLDDTLVVSHMRYTDTRQQVTVDRGEAEISTRAKIMGNRNGQTIGMVGSSEHDVLPVEDVITATGLHPCADVNIECRIIDVVTGGELFSRTDRVPLNGESSLAYTAENLFLPLYKMAGASAVITVTITDAADGAVLGAHSDLLDADETLTVIPEDTVSISTKADFAVSGNSAGLNVRISDTITLDNTDRWIEGGYLETQIIDKESGLVIACREQKVDDVYGGWDTLQVESDLQDFTITDPSLLILGHSAPGEVFAALGGRTFVIFERLKYYDTEVAHSDIDDPDQTFTVEWGTLETEAEYEGAHIAPAEPNVHVQDRVRFTSATQPAWLRADSAVLKGYAIRLRDHSVIAAAEKSLDEYLPLENGAEIINDFTLDLSQCANEDIVFMEQIIDSRNGAVFFSHEDLCDVSQRISVAPAAPTISTTARSSEGTSVVYNGKPQKITDEVVLHNLKIGRAYTLKTTLASADDGAEYASPSATTEFTPGSSDETVSTTLSYHAQAPAGSKVVVFERLYLDGELVSEHTDKDDDAQTLEVRGLEFATSATGANGLKTLPASGHTTVTDHIETPEGSFVGGNYYVVRTYLADKSTGELLRTGDSEVFAENTVESRHNGTISTDITFSFNGVGLADRDIVVFEDICTLNGVLVASHRDLSDEDQTLHLTPAPALSTCASAPDGSKLVPAKRFTLTDTVTYACLTAGEEYILRGRVVNLNTGDLLAEKELPFTPDADTGEIQMSFDVHAEGMLGQSLIVYEELFDTDGNLIADHVDGASSSQQVRVAPQLRTYASMPNGTSFTPPAEHTPITDRIEYSDFTDGGVYRFEGSVVLTDTEEIVAVNSQMFRAEGSEGTFTMTFDADTRELAGRFLTICYKVYHKGALVAEHCDLADRFQTIFVTDDDTPQIFTDARVSGRHEAVSHGTAPIAIEDTLFYRGLVAGETYRIVTHLFSADTGEELTAPLVSEMTAALNGQWTVAVSYAPGITPVRAVVGQEVFTMDGTKLLSHIDLNDPSQTISFRPPVLETHAAETVPA